MARETERPLDTDKRKAREDRAVAFEKDHQVRLRSVANDTQLQLPVNIAMPDGEEYPGSQFQLRSNDQRSEILKGYIQGPPNKTICESASACIDWDTGDVRSTRSGKSGSKGHQLWGLKLSGSSSSSGGLGKSPPSHSRPARDHPRHSSTTKPTTTSPSSGKHKNSSGSSSSSTCSSTSSSTSSCTGLGGALLHKSPCSVPSSISERIHTVIAEKLFTGGDGGRTSNSKNNSTSLLTGTGGLSNTRGDGPSSRTNSKGSGGGGSKKLGQNWQCGHPNGAGGKGTSSVLTSSVSTSTMTTRSSSTTTMTLQCDPSTITTTKKKSSTLLHQKSETFSERMEGVASVMFPPSSGDFRARSDSDNNGNGNAGGHPPPLRLGTSAPGRKTGGDGGEWAGPWRDDGIQCFHSQKSVQMDPSEVISRTEERSSNQLVNPIGNSTTTENFMTHHPPPSPSDQYSNLTSPDAVQLFERRK